MAKEIKTSGERQIKALFVSAANPVLSVPNGNELEEALDGLDLSVALDCYITETTAHCDYVLPVTTMYERAGARRVAVGDVLADRSAGAGRPDLITLTAKQGHLPLAGEIPAGPNSNFRCWNTVSARRRPRRWRRRP
jgi:molybdopterin-dependent oxidoreductase-like protein